MRDRERERERDQSKLNTHTHTHGLACLHVWLVRIEEGNQVRANDNDVFGNNVGRQGYQAQHSHRLVGREFWWLAQLLVGSRAHFVAQVQENGLDGGGRVPVAKSVEFRGNNLQSQPTGVDQSTTSTWISAWCGDVVTAPAAMVATVLAIATYFTVGRVDAIHVNSRNKAYGGLLGRIVRATVNEDCVDAAIMRGLLSVGSSSSNSSSTTATKHQPRVNQRIAQGIALTIVMTTQCMRTTLHRS
jgi:hypothetical protein